MSNSSNSDIWKGIGVVLFCHLGALVILSLLQLGLLWMFLGVTQLLYIVPLTLHYRKTEPRVAAGIWIGAGVTFLLNAACYGLFFGLALL